MTADANSSSRPIGVQQGHFLELTGQGSRLLFEHTREMVCTLDLEGRFTSVNRAGEDLTGYSGEALVGRLAVDLIAPELRQRAVRQFRERIRANDGSPDATVLLTHQGNRVPIEVTSATIRHDGRAVGVLSVITDVSARKRAEEALERSEQRFGALVEAAPDGIVIVDTEGRITLLNAQAETLFGYPRDDLVGQPIETLLPEHLHSAHRQHRLEYLDHRSTQPMGSGLELQGRRKDGSTFPLEVSLSSLETDDGLVVVAAVRDVSERKRSEAALLESEERFRASFRSAATGMALVALDGRLLEVNQALCDLVGESEANLLERSLEAITHPGDRARDLEQRRRILAGEIRSYQLEQRFLPSGGGLVWVLLSVSLAMSADGEARYLVAQMQDVTERKHAVEELERRESQLAEAQQVAHIGSWEFEYAKGTVSMSRELYRIYGFEPDTVVTPALLEERVHPPDRERVLAAAERKLEAGESSELEFRVLWPDGRLRWLYSRSEPVLDAGVPIGKRGIAEDITERKEAEERLAEAERRYRLLVEHLPLAIYIRSLDMSQPCIYASPQVEAMLGYPREQWESDPDLLAKAVYPDDRERVLADAALVRAGGEPFLTEYRYVTPEGRVVWVQDETHLVCDDDGKPLHVQGFLRDITERRQAEAERDRLREELHHAQKLEALGRLAGGVAHDFNNMLTAIRGYSELLLGDTESHTPAHQHAAQIKRAAEQAAALPQQLLAFGRKQTLEPRIVDVNELVARSAGLLKHVVSEAVDVTTVPASQPALAHVDAGRLDQVLVNLALNARDAMPGGGTLTITTSFADVGEGEAREHGATAGAYVVISVADTGQGMDADTQARAFEPFFTTKSQGKGSGLGLASAYGTISQSGGFISLESEPGRGSTFRLHLPAAGPADEAVATAQSECAPPPGKPLALLAEDEEIVRNLVAAVLTSAGFEVHATANGAEAEAWLQQHAREPVAVLVTDMVMPRLGGAELAHRARALQPGTPIVFMSGYTETPVGAETYLRPDTAFLQKPFSNEALLAAVRDVTGADRSASRRRGDDHGDAITCVVADDHPSVLDSVCRYLEAQGISVVSRATRADDALQAIAAERPTTALLDIAMAPFDGIEVTRRAALDRSPTGIVLYTGYRDQALLQQALEAGARGFVLKDAPLETLVEALAAVADGRTYVDRELADALVAGASSAPLPSLTPRERQILGLLSEGMTNDRVGGTLGISAETVQSHVRNAMVKLDADTRTQAVATAIRLSLLT